MRETEVKIKSNGSEMGPITTDFDETRCDLIPPMRPRSSGVSRVKKPHFEHVSLWGNLFSGPGDDMEASRGGWMEDWVRVRVRAGGPRGKQFSECGFSTREPPEDLGRIGGSDPT